MKMRLIIFFYCIFSKVDFTLTANAFNCHLPDGCRLERGYISENFDLNEIGDRNNFIMIMCDINNNEFSFKFKDPPNFVNGEGCIIESNHTNKIYFRWTSKKLTILDRKFNFTNIFRYLNYMKKQTNVDLSNLKAFDLHFLGKNYKSNYKSHIFNIKLSKLRLDFYHNKKKMNSCDDIFKSNVTNIMSIFQLILANTNKISGNFELKSVEYKHSICPLVFNNSIIYRLVLIDLSDTFYKRNVLSFTNETYKYLQSDIQHLQLHKLQYINLDLKLLNPSIFKRTREIFIYSGSLNSIDGAIFRNLKNLVYFYIDPIIFKKIIHKQGIEWIRQWNLGVNLNLTKIKDNKLNTSFNETPKRVVLIKIRQKTRKRMSIIFPDEDFCIYVDFPFNQFVVLYEYIEAQIIYILKDNEFSCTYLWLAQYYEIYYKNLLTIKTNKMNATIKNIMRVFNSTAFKSMWKCNFEKRIDLCNKSNYQLKDIWDESDIFILSKKMQIAFKIILYPTAFLGLITNIIVVIVILIKENSDLFKGIKQYSYLYLNSIFCIIIMIIELLSWMTECFYPFEVFCPEIRKIVPIQFFKIIFKECLITVLRFMCSFTYVAFALNRISLIGKDHGKLVTFFSQLGIKVFIGVTILISSSLSWIKGFKYQVNYFFPYFNYPMSTEMDITIIQSNTFDDAYFIFNFISDFFNYVVFVIVCVIIDICMVIQLRRVLGDKTKKIESMNQKQDETKKEENENVVNKAIKMVVLNSAIGIFFKLSASFIPLLNVVAEYYYKDKIYKYNHPGFGEFYSMLQDTELYSLIQDISYFLYTLSLSIQMFIYKRFDKKFKIGFDRLREKTLSDIKNLFKKSKNSNS